MDVELRIRDGNGTRTELLSHEWLRELAKFYELDTLSPNRYTSLFVANLYLLDKESGVNPACVIEEIKSLEGLASPQKTKPAAEFKGSTLKGLWHKHFMPAHPSAIAHNVLNHLGKNGLAQIADEIFDPAVSRVITKGMLHELADRAVVKSIIDRGAAGKLTGEWIIFAKENGENYYLCISSHASGDERIASNVKVCSREFPFLSKYAP